MPLACFQYTFPHPFSVQRLGPTLRPRRPRPQLGPVLAQMQGVTVGVVVGPRGTSGLRGTEEDHGAITISAPKQLYRSDNLTHSRPWRPKAVYLGHRQAPATLSTVPRRWSQPSQPAHAAHVMLWWVHTAIYPSLWCSAFQSLPSVHSVIRARLFKHCEVHSQSRQSTLECREQSRGRGEFNSPNIRKSSRASVVFGARLVASLRAWSRVGVRS